MYEEKCHDEEERQEDKFKYQDNQGLTILQCCCRSHVMLQVWCNKRGVVTGAEFSSSMVAASTEWSAQWSRYPIMDIVLAGLRQGRYCDKHRNIVKYLIS